MTSILRGRIRSDDEFKRLNDLVSQEGGILVTEGGWGRGSKNVIASFETEIAAAKAKAMTFAFQRRRLVR